MKKILIALLLVFPFFYSCKSIPADLKSYNPVVIMTVYSNPSVPWYDEQTKSETVNDGILSGAVNRLINKKNPELTTVQERIDEASAMLSERMRDFGLDVIDPTVLKDSPAYKKAGKNFLDYLGNTVPATGYDAITSSNGKLNRATCKETGAKSTVYVKFRFQKVYAKKGVRNVGVAARLVMTVFATDAEGKKILSKEYKAVSEEYTDLIKSSDWDKEKLLSFFPALENKLITEFLTDYVFDADSEAISKEYKPTAIKVKSKETATEISENSENSATSETPESSAENAVLAEKQATAKKLLERGMTAEEVSEITGLSIEEIKGLQ